VKILLDECIDQRLARDIVGHEVKTVPQMGWAGLANGELLAKAEVAFDAFVTVDLKLPEQQVPSKFRLAMFLLRASSNRVDDLRPLVSELLAALPHAKAGRVQVIGG